MMIMYNTALVVTTDNCSMTPDNERKYKPYEWIQKHPSSLEVIAPAVLFWSEYLIKTERLNREHLKRAADHVNSGSGGLLIVSNHLSMLDAKVMLEVRRKINPKISFTALWADKFVGMDSTGDTHQNTYEADKWRMFGKIGSSLAQHAGINLVSVPQVATREGIRRADEILSSVRDMSLGKKAVLGFFPEGTRSRSGSLQTAKAGAVNRLFRERSDIQAHTLILPVAVQGTNGVLSTSEGFNPFNPVTITYGRPFTYSEATAEMKQHNLSLADVFMLRIGTMLPEEMWGEYTETFRQLLKTSSQ